jgi:hypothetical protein
MVCQQQHRRLLFGEEELHICIQRRQPSATSIYSSGYSTLLPSAIFRSQLHYIALHKTSLQELYSLRRTIGYFLRTFKPLSMTKPGVSLHKRHASICCPPLRQTDTFINRNRNQPIPKSSASWTGPQVCLLAPNAFFSSLPA